MMRLAHAGPSVLLALLLKVPCLGAQPQTVELRVRLEAAPGIPVGGALVALLDPSGRVITEGLSSEDGRRLLRATAGSYRVRVRRIGFQPFLSEPVSIPRTGELNLLVETQRVVLDAIVVRARSECRRIDRDAEALVTVWEEIAKALRASELTLGDLSGIARARVYRREVELGGAVTASDTTIIAVTDRRPFGAADPAFLARDGYVRGNEYRGWRYFGPDEMVLLSEEFAATHCFSLMRDPARRGQIGLVFDPVPRRRVPDIAGVLWLDESSAELREMIFRYVNAGLASQYESGGFTRFRRMPSGAWIVDEWRLRMPRLRVRPGAFSTVSLLGFMETGGGIIADRGRAAASGPTATLSGVIYDSLAHRPLSGAVVTLQETVARSDDSGRFTFTHAPVGAQIVSFSHPALSALGLLAIERELELRGDSVAVALSVPSYQTLWGRICSDSVWEVQWNESGILHGVVRDEAGDPAAGVRVRVSWLEGALGTGTAPSREVLEVTSDDVGRYAACGFRRSSRGTVTAFGSPLRSPGRDFSFTIARVVRRDLSLEAGAIAEDADERRELIVTVMDTTGNPLADATVFIEGTAEVARTDDAGRAVLRAVQRDLDIRARRIGFSEQAMQVRLGEGRRQQLRVVLSPIQSLPTVRVVAAAPMPRSIERRRTLSTASFYGPDEVAAVHDVKMLLARTPGAAIEGTGRWTVRFRHPNWGGDCYADVYIDGVLSAPSVSSFEGGFVKTEELQSLASSMVYAMEVYPRASQAPQDIVRLRDGCGVILVWTHAWAERELQGEQRPGEARAAPDTSAGRD